jgi:hypothetical protein
MKTGRHHEWLEDRFGHAHVFRVYVERDHAPDCPIAVSDPYWCNTNQVVFRASDGLKRGSNMPWTRWRCNSFKCPATILVCDSSIVELINRAIFLGRKSGR